MKRSTLQVVPQPKRVQVETRVGLFNPSFKYIRAAETDVRATFERIRREQAAGRRA